jgi:hypothetical protein
VTTQHSVQHSVFWRVARFHLPKSIVPFVQIGSHHDNVHRRKPASRRPLAIASAAIVVLPTESVVLISISCLKMSVAV